METYITEFCHECKNTIIRQAFRDDWACTFSQCKYYNGHKAAKEKEYIEGYKKWEKQQADDDKSQRFNELLRKVGTVKMLDWVEENQKYKTLVNHLINHHYLFPARFFSDFNDILKIHGFYL